MKAIAVNGSPRQGWNTATLLDEALAGAAAGGAQTERVDLYQLRYQGCISCFACKLRGGSSYGRCAVEDPLTPVLERVVQAEVLILGSPIYFGNITGEMQSFLERLLFPYLAYTESFASLFPGTLAAAFVYTMNLPRDQASAYGYPYLFNTHRRYLERTFGNAETLTVFDTLQFDDYARFVADRFDAAAKARRHREHFPQERRQAFTLGERLVARRRKLCGTAAAD